MAKTFKVPFAFDSNNNIVDIDSAEKGIVYNCSCGSDVKLRGGNFISDHFYHIDESQCSLESAIHKAYKAVFEKLKKIKLPYTVNGNDLLIFDRVELEKKIDDYIPDAIGYIGDERYLIEFAKSSYIGKRKEDKIKKSNLFCLEVDIIKTIGSLIEIENHLVSDKGYKHLIHVPEYKEMKLLRAKFEQEYKRLKDDLESEIAILERKVDKLESNLSVFNEINNDCGLFFVRHCKNGAKMYHRKLSGFGQEVVAFQNGKVINVKFNI